MKNQALIEEARDRAAHMKLLAKVTENSPGAVRALEEADRMTRFADALEAALAARHPTVDDREAEKIAARLFPLDGSEPDTVFEARRRAVEAIRNSCTAVPDAATEIARNLANATALTGQDARVIAEAAVKVAAAGEIAEDHALCDGRLLSVEKHAERMEAERDAALAAVERVRAIDTGNNRALYGNDFEAGMAKALWLVKTALDGAPEPEWEYGLSVQAWRDEEPEPHPTREAAQHVIDNPELYRKWTHDNPVTMHRRRKAGPWLPVEGESK